jgi:glycosyltransferase involved in cell wall biosynthesis
MLKNEGYEIYHEIASDGPERNNLENLAKNLGLSGVVRFTGLYNHRDFPNILKQHQLFLLPSWDEAFGVVYVEAMAMGLPVIAANDAGAPDVVTEGKDGYLVPPRDPVAIATVIRRYIKLSNKEKLTLSNNAKKKAQMFTWKKNAERIKKLLEG